MEMTQIHQIAKQLVEVHGRTAEAQAAQKLKQAQGQKDAEQIELWQRVQAAIREMGPPHES